jgi:hypothetical protein
MKDRYESSYLEAAKRYEKFAREGRETLMDHVAAICWFEPNYLEYTKQVAAIVGSEGRRRILESWEGYLQSASRDVAEVFAQKVLFPYWDWSRKQKFFSIPEGDYERFGFWELLPYTHDKFPDAAKRALAAPPSKIEHSGFLTDRLNAPVLSKDFTISVSVLAKLLELDQSANWKRDEWLALWNSVKDSGAEGLEDFRVALAKKQLVD